MDYIDVPKRSLLPVPGYTEPVEFGVLTSFACVGRSHLPPLTCPVPFAPMRCTTHSAPCQRPILHWLCCKPKGCR